MKARRALGAAKGVVGAVRACGHRIAFRCRNRAAYPRRCSAPPAVSITGPQQPLSALSLRQLDTLRAKLEAEEAGLMEKLRELWQHLAMGDHLQPAFADPDRLAHVTRLLLAGDTEAVERDPNNDEVSGAATMQLTSQRLEAALVEVHAQVQAVCEERRRRKGLQGAANAAAHGHAASLGSPRRGGKHYKHHATAAGAAAAGGSGAKRALSFSASSFGVTTAAAAPGRTSRSGGCSNEMPKRKLSTLSLTQAFMDDGGATDCQDADGVGTPRLKVMGKWQARLGRRTGGGAGTEVPCSFPACDGDEVHLHLLEEMGYTKVPTHE